MTTSEVENGGINETNEQSKIENLGDAENGMDGGEIINRDLAMIDNIKGGEEANANARDITVGTTESYGSKVKNSCTGVCFGFVLYFASIALLIWNEGRTVKRAKDIDEGRETLIEFDLNNFTNTSIPTTFDNQLIHAIGDLNTMDVLTDSTFGVTSQSNTSAYFSKNLLKLQRSVEMYQWKESSSSTTKKNLDGSTYTETTYSYSKVWSSRVIDSTRFHEQSSTRTNPGSFPFEPMTLEADPVYLGNKIVLNEDIVSTFNWYTPIDMLNISNVPDPSLQARLSVFSPNLFFYKSGDTNGTIDRPNVGDTKISFSAVEPDTISIVARLYPDSDADGRHNLGSHTTDRGGQLLLIERGVYTAEEMFTQAEADNTTTAWILRIVGFLLMVFSILLILQPLATIVDIVPFIGDFIQSTMENFLFPLIAVIIAIPTCLFVITLAWLAYRPTIAIPIAVGSLLLMIVLYWRIHKKKQQQNNDNNDISENPMKPHQAINTPSEKIDEMNNDSYSPYNSPGHNAVNSYTHGGANVDEKMNDDGFAGALDHEVEQPASSDNYKMNHPKIDNTEEDVVFK